MKRFLTSCLILLAVLVTTVQADVTIETVPGFFGYAINPTIIDMQNNLVGKQNRLLWRGH